MIYCKIKKRAGDRDVFFQNDYEESGANPNVPEKTGLSLAGELLTTESITLVKLNLMFLISCVPLITVPAALFALQHELRTLILGRPSRCVSGYWDVFRRFWKRGWAAFLLTAVPLAVSGVGMWFYLSRAKAVPLLFLPFMFCSTVFLLTLLASGYFYPLLADGRSLQKSLRLALFLGAAKPFRAFLAALAVWGMLLVAVLAFPLSLPYLLLIGFSVPGLLGNFFVRTVLRDYESR